MLLTVGAGVLLSSLVALIYLRRRPAKKPSQGVKELPPSSEDSSSTEDVAEEIIATHEASSSLQQLDLNTNTKDYLKNNSNEDIHSGSDQNQSTDTPEERLNKEEIERIQALLEEEIQKRKASEAKAKDLQRTLNSQTLAAKTSEEKYNKLLQRFNVVSSKLKVAEERCRTLVDAINSQDSGDEMEADKGHVTSKHLLALEEEDECYTDEEDLSDDDSQSDDSHGHQSLFRPIVKPETKTPGSNDLEFELSQDVMEALVASAVGDSQDEEDDVDSLSEMVAENMDEEDLDDLIQSGTNISGLNIDLIENEDDDENQDLADVKSRRQFWQQKANGHNDHKSSEQSDQERDDLIKELKANLKNGLDNMISYSEDRENMNPNANDSDLHIEEMDLTNLKQKLEQHQMLITQEDHVDS